MSIVTKAILKGYFETGDRPTEGQFIDLIDSIVTLTHANTGDVTIVGTLTVDNINIGSHISASRVSASGGFEADTLSTSSFGYISSSGDISTSGNIFAREGVLEITNVSASSFTNIYSLSHITSSGNISASGDVIGFTGSFHYLEGDGSGLTNIHVEDVVHGNKVSVTGSQKVTSNTNNTVATNNTGEFTIPIGANYTVETGGQVDLQYTPIAERVYRYDVDTGNFIPYAQANIDSETTLMKGFGAGTAGVGNDITVRHNATVPENFVTTLYTTAHNVTQSEDPNNNPIVNDPNSITIQDQSTYTIKAGADVTVDGVHHGVVRKDIALFKTMGIGDTQAIGPSGSDSFNDQYNNIYPSASAHLHISASNPVVKIEASSGTGLLSIDGNISASGGTVTALSGSFSELSGNSPLTVNGEVIFTGVVKTSGNISASGEISASNGFEAGTTSTSSFGFISASGTISTSKAIIANSLSFLPGMFIRDDSISTSAGNIYFSDGIEVGGTGHITASGNISASGTLTAENIELPPGGAIRPTVNSNTISFRAHDHGSAEYMEIGSDIFNVYMDGRNTFAIARTNVQEGQITLNATNDNYDVSIKYDDTSTAFTSNAASHFVQMSGPVVISRSGSATATPLGSNFSAVTDGNSALQLSGSLFTDGHITASSNISASGDITGVTGSFEGGLVLTSPNGTKYRFTTNDSGHLSLTGSAV